MHSKEEVEEFQRISSALVVNVGTLTPAWVESMHLAAAAANAAGHPWVLDPVGAGATKFRTQVGLQVYTVPCIHPSVHFVCSLAELLAISFRATYLM